MALESGKYGNYYHCATCKIIKTANEKVEIPTDQICEKCGAPLVQKEGKNGTFLACSRFPNCRFTKPLNEVLSSEKCPKCGGDMVERKGKFGDYSQCKVCNNTVSKVKYLGKCPECGSDTKVMKTRNGKTYYGCSKYPECDFHSWEEPTGKRCSKCGSYTVKVNGVEKCSNEKCETNQVEKVESVNV